MVSSENRLAAFRSQLPALSDEALGSIASKGLLRRGQKDLQEQPPELLDTTQALTMRVDDCTVTFPITGPTHATCTCAAPDICRHILTVCLWLRHQFAATEEMNSSPEVPVLNYTLEKLIHWAGKPTVRTAFDWLKQGIPYTIHHQDAIVVQFTDVNVICRYFSATGLNGMICSCKSRPVCHHQVAAVVVYQRSQGMTIDLPAAATAFQTVSGTPRSRTEIIESVQQLLSEMVSVGLLHLSDAVQQRLTTLAVSALGVNLPRLSLALRRGADEIALSLQRNTRADESRLLLGMAQTYALCAALRQMPEPDRPDLVGQSRSHYDNVGTLALIGMGAYYWQTKSGYTGLTVLFWQPDSQQWHSWSEARPLFHGTGFNPVLRYQQAGPWQGVESPAQASKSQLLLTAARRNAQCRLSASTQTQAMITAPTQIETLPQFNTCSFTDWHTLRTYAAANVAIGLSEPNPLQQIVIVRPTTWGPRSFNPIEQTFTWLLFDQQAQIIPLRVPFRPVDTDRLHQLEQLDPEQAQIWGIVCQITIDAAGLSLYPLSLLCQAQSQAESGQAQPGQSAVINLSFAAQPAPSDTLPDSMISATEDIDPPEWTELSSASNFLEQQIADLIDRLQPLAEGGLYRLTPAMRQDLLLQAKAIDTAGLTLLATAVKRLAQANDAIAMLLLQVRYLCQLCQQAAVQQKLTNPESV